MSISRTPLTGRKSITQTASQIKNTTDVAKEGVLIYSDVDNSGVIYVGGHTGITANSGDDTDGFPIVAGSSLLVPVRKMADLYAVSDSTAESNTIWWMMM